MGKHFIKEVGSQDDREEKVLMRLFGGFEDAIEDLNRADAVDSRVYMMLDQFFLQLSTEILNVCNTSRGKRLCISNHLSYGSHPKLCRNSCFREWHDLLHLIGICKIYLIIQGRR